jgi:hypothetical protein
MEEKMKAIEVSGPFFRFSSPYGIATLERDEWFVSRKLTEEELKTASPIAKLLKSTSLGHISKFRGNNSYVINSLYPIKRFKTLKGAINFLVKNDGKLVFCT